MVLVVSVAVRIWLAFVWITKHLSTWVLCYNV